MSLYQLAKFSTRGNLEKMKSFAFFMIGMILGGCESSTYEEFKEQGKKETRELIRELRMVRTKDQLIQRKKILEHHLKEIGALAEKVEIHQLSHPEEETPLLEPEDHALSEALRLEILRVYRLEGGKEVIDASRKRLKY